VRGILAAAGPSAVYLWKTARVRSAFKDAKTKGELVRLEPELSLPCPRLSHVTFTIDGSCLVIAAESGGGLAVYSVDSLLNKGTQPALELPTQGVGIRALAPNPSKEAAHIVATVLQNGHLMMADLKGRTFVRSRNNTASLRDGVTCVSWSVRGKQLVAGLQDGTAVQLDPLGDLKATIPRPPDLAIGFAGKSFLNYRSTLIAQSRPLCGWPTRSSCSYTRMLPEPERTFRNRPSVTFKQTRAAPGSNSGPA
jgi:nucleoporin NUP159